MNSNIDVEELNEGIINKILDSTYGVVVSFLKRKEIKKLLIKDYSYYDFFNFYYEKNPDYIETLYNDDEAISYLKEARDAREKIIAILKSDVSNKYLNNDLFVEILLTKLDSKDLAIINDKNKIKDFLFNPKYNGILTKSKKSALIINLPYEEAINYLKIDDIANYDLEFLFRDSMILKWVINNKRVFLSNVSLKALDTLFTYSDFDIPQYLIDDIDFVYYIANNDNILLTRKILFSLNKKGLDTSKIESKRKQYYDNLITNTKSNMLTKYYNFYNELFLNEDYTIETFDNTFENFFDKDEDYYINPNGYFDFLDQSFYVLRKIFSNARLDIVEKKKQTKDLLSRISQKAATNLLIDYHFEEYYYNVLIDISELLNFSLTTKTNLNKDNYNIYLKLLNLENSDLNTIKNFHNRLKEKNIIEMFYDDMSNARYIMNKAIADSIITKEELKKYKNEEKSNEYGVDIYEFNGEEFFALVKSGEHTNHENPYGHSFSLIGKNAIGTFASPDFKNNYIYEGLKPEQIVHVFPYDSFTSYTRDGNSSENVRVLMSPNDLLNNSGEYNELLILEEGTTPNEMDKYIPELKQIALYCYDELTEADIETAKDKDIGIMLINTKKYKFGNKTEIRGQSFQKYEYYNGDNSKVLEEIRKDITM